MELKRTLKSQSLINQGNILTPHTKISKVLTTPIVAIPYKSGKYSYLTLILKPAEAGKGVAIPYKSGKYSYWLNIIVLACAARVVSQSLINQGNILTKEQTEEEKNIESDESQSLINQGNILT